MIEMIICPDCGFGTESVKDWAEHGSYDCVTILKSKLAEASAEIAALKAAQAWHPASEPPAEGQEIWAREANSPIIARFIFTKKLFDIFLRHYTHWQPVQMPELPAPPEVTDVN